MLTPLSTIPKTASSGQLGGQTNKLETVFKYRQTNIELK